MTKKKLSEIFERIERNFFKIFCLKINVPKICAPQYLWPKFCPPIFMTSLRRWTRSPAHFKGDFFRAFAHVFPRHWSLVLNRQLQLLTLTILFRLWLTPTFGRTAYRSRVVVPGRMAARHSFIDTSLLFNCTLNTDIFTHLHSGTRTYVITDCCRKLAVRCLEIYRIITRHVHDSQQ